MNEANGMDILQRYGPQLGEIAQHEINVDTKIAETSDWYFNIFGGLLKRNPGITKNRPLRMLEIACYRHVLSYRIAQEHGFEVTLFDVSDYDLDAGRQIAEELNYPTDAERVAGEFHNLPFADGYFDFVYVSAALHHTRHPERVIAEAMRVIADDGHFYCQREPIERMFCFYKFPGNRAYAHTAFEKQILQQDITRIICSPFPGARNAVSFGRIENDRIPLEHWVSALRQHGEIVEEMLYYDGLLTALDKEILAEDTLPESELADFINDRLTAEIGTAAPKLTRQDALLGHEVPTPDEVQHMAERVAAAIKARHPNQKTNAWRRDMARIFGAGARFLVRRKRCNGLRSDVKYRRAPTAKGSVLLDNGAYEGLRFWDRLLPDLAKASPDDLAIQFPPDQWMVVAERENMRVLGARAGRAAIRPATDKPAVVAIRCQVVVDEKLPVARLRVSYGDGQVAEILIPQTEDHVIKVKCDRPGTEISMQLCGEDGANIDLPSRIRVNVLQAVPLTAESTLLQGVDLSRVLRDSQTFVGSE